MLSVGAGSLASVVGFVVGFCALLGLCSGVDVELVGEAMSVLVFADVVMLLGVLAKGACVNQ